MPKKKKVEDSGEVKVEEVVEEVIVKAIAPLETGVRHEVDVLVSKINEIIEKVN